MSVETIAVVLHHSRAKGTAKLVLVGIANHDGDGGAWPSIATLSRYAGVADRNVQKAIKDLAELGEIVVHVQDGGNHKTRGDRRPNRYEVLVQCPPECDRSRHHRMPEVDGVTNTSPRHGVTLATPRGDVSDAHGVTLASPEPPNNQYQEPALFSSSPQAATARAAGASVGVEAWARFWEVYPRKVGKAAALKAFTKALSRATAADVVAGAERLAADPNLPEMQYVPHAATWLNRDGWQDAPYPPRGRQSAAARGMDVVRSLAEQDGLMPGRPALMGGSR